MTAKVKKLGKKDKRDREELKRAVLALNATQHNPIDFAPVIRFTAPIIASYAARIAVNYAVKKLNKKMPKKLREETVDVVLDRLTDILSAVKGVTK